MDSETGSGVNMFFFPFLVEGHQIPMIDTARVFASHGAKSTILTTSSNALHFQKSITRDPNFGLPITIHSLALPEHVEISDIDMSAGPMTDTSVLCEPLRQFLVLHRPDCIVVDMLHGWAGELTDELKIPRIFFTGSGCFPRCVHENIRRYSVLDKVASDSEPFVVPDLPHRIEMTRSQLPIFFREPSLFPDRMKGQEEKSFGTVINSFHDLEPAYADYLRRALGRRAWLIGPVSLCNRTAEDKTERGKPSTIEGQSCLNWLNSKEPSSVIYVSFGSLARLPPKQLKEIAHGLEASGESFIWVVGKVFNSSKNEEEKTGDDNDDDGDAEWLPIGFEQRMKDSNKGQIIRGWAPQLLILEHAAIGGFVTHCGWNSTLEGVTAGVPMVTWPLTVEQFSNEKLITEVLRIGVQVGSREWVSGNAEWPELVGREKVELAVKRLMEKSEEAEEMRNRAKEIARNAQKAVEKGGTSYADADALIEELKVLRVSGKV